MHPHVAILSSWFWVFEREGMNEHPAATQTFLIYQSKI